jgi:predicted O-methyltransferase YrrM
VSVFLHFLKWNVGLADAETQTTPEERDCLARHAASRRVLAEVGVWHGVTTARLRRAMAADGLLYAVDPFPPGQLGFSVQQRIARWEVARVPNGRVEWMRATGADAARMLGTAAHGRLEFVFLDGDHSYDGLKADWEGWSPLLAPGGIAALHDSRSGPRRPIDSAGSLRYTSDVIRHDPRFTIVDEQDSLTVLERRR